MADEGFLQRWSRRKAEARTPSKEPEAVPDPIARQEDAAKAPEPHSPATAGHAPAADEDAIDLDALPDVDTLTYESDFTVFLRKGVPPELRRRALQRLWRSNPTLANLDGLVEYGEDYTQIGAAGQVVRTAYQVGRGMLERIEKAPGAARALAGDASGAAPDQPPRPSLPAAEDPDASRPAGEAADETRAAIAERQAEPPRPTGDSAPAEDRSRPVKRPRPLPRRS